MVRNASRVCEPAGLQTASPLSALAPNPHAHHPTRPQITPRDYLETALRPVSGTGPSVAAKNGIRASITQLFPNRSAPFAIAFRLPTHLSTSWHLVVYPAVCLVLLASALEPLARKGVLPCWVTKPTM